MPDRVCEVEGCGSIIGRHGAKGMCPRHYSRWKRWGDPHAKKRNSIGRKAYKGTPTHNSYSGMKQRCQNKNNPNYSHYGGRGIKVCERWLGVYGFQHFIEDMGERPEGCTLDRIDPSGDYRPENCRWASYRVQAGNKTKPRGGTNIVGVWKYNDRYWVATLGVGRKTIFRYFREKDEAIRGRLELEELYPDNNHPNIESP